MLPLGRGYFHHGRWATARSPVSQAARRRSGWRDCAVRVAGWELAVWCGALFEGKQKRKTFSSASFRNSTFEKMHKCFVFSITNVSSLTKKLFELQKLLFLSVLASMWWKVQLYERDVVQETLIFLQVSGAEKLHYIASVYIMDFYCTICRRWKLVKFKRDLTNWLTVTVTLLHTALGCFFFE